MRFVRKINNKTVDLSFIEVLQKGGSVEDDVSAFAGVIEINSGDFPPDAAFAFGEACEKAVEIWVSANKSED